MPPEVLKALSHVTVRVLLPLFTGSSVAKSAAGAMATGSFAKLWLLPCTAFGHCLLAYSLACLFCGLLGIAPGSPEGRLLSTLASWGNSAMPVLLAQALFRERPEVLTHLVGGVALYLLGWNLTFWSFGYNLVASALGHKDSAKETSDEAGKDKSRLLVVATRVLSQPPVVGALCGLLIGLAPPLRDLFVPVVSRPTPLFAPLFRAAENLGTAAMPLSSMVMAGSLATSGAALQKGADVPDGLAALVASRRGLAVVACVRLVALPMLVGTALCNTLTQLGLMSSLSMGSRVIMYIALAEASMPSAQAAVLIPQLLGRPDVSAALARVAVGVYALAVPFVCLWVATWLRVTGL